MRTHLLATLCAAALLTAIGPAAPAGATPTAPASPASPGDLVSAAQIWAAGFEAAKVWKVTYRSTTATGTPMVVSGTVIVPRAGYAGPRPIVSYAIGTHGLGDQCAPSNELAWGIDGESSVMHQYTNRGWALAITDYQGLGTPGDHTYVVGRAEGDAVLDIVRAAQRLPGAGLSTDAPVGITGYSQGGQAAGWAAQLQPTYAPELHLKGSLVGAPPADLRRAAQFQDGNAAFALILGAGVGLDAAYPELRLQDYLNPAGTAAFNDVRDECVATFAVKYAFRHLSDFTTSDVLNTPAWRSRLDEQRLGGISPTAPVLLYHSAEDELLPQDLSVGLRARWCAGGVNTTWWPLHTGGHVTTLEVMAPAVIGWLGDRLDGQGAQGNC